MSTEPLAAARQAGSVLRGFEDGLGKRFSPARRSESDAPLEILLFRQEITEVPSFEFALRERVARLADFHHPYYVRIRKVDRLSDDAGTVALMSDGASGVRLSELLTASALGRPALDLDAAFCLIRQLVPAIAALHDHARVAHGAVAPERMFVTPMARLFIVEYALGAALEQLKYSRERYWRELRVALPMAVGISKFDERADLTQVGATALALVLGRPIRDEEYPGEVEDLVSSAPILNEWLRTLQLDVRNSFRSLFEAQAALDQLLPVEGKYNGEVSSLEGFLKKYQESLRLDAPPKEAPAPKPVAVVEPVVEPKEVVRILPDPPYLPKPFEPVKSFNVEPAAPAEVPAEEPDEMDNEEMPTFQTHRPSSLKWIAAGLIVITAATGGVYAARRRGTSGLPVSDGTLTVTTDPPGARVEIDGSARGQTPLSLSLSAGSHTLVVRGAGGDPRTMPITINAGTQVSQYLDLPKAAAATGQLQVRSEPTGARISVDGIPHGLTPITVIELAPGDHSVKLDSEAGSVTQTVAVQAGVTASLVVPLGGSAATPASGWVSVSSPLAMDLYEQGKLLGSTRIDRIMLPSGRHEIEIVNETLEYRETRTVQVTPGKVSPIAIVLPQGNVSINAVPWATVSIDGQAVGDTPIGNLPIAIGPHEVVFRNAELGEQRRVITVTTRSTARLSVDMAKK